MTKQLLGGDICPGCNRGDKQGWFLYTAVTRPSPSDDDEEEDDDDDLRLMILIADEFSMFVERVVVCLGWGDETLFSLWVRGDVKM